MPDKQPDNTLKNTEVKVFSLDDGKYYYVTEGLKAGEKIVIEGVQRSISALNCAGTSPQ